MQPRILSHSSNSERGKMQMCMRRECTCTLCLLESGSNNTSETRISVLSCIIIPISWFRISANRPSTLEVSFSMLTFLMLLVFLMLICIHRHIPSPVLVPIFSGLYRRLRLKRVNICYLISVPHFITPLPIHTYLYLNDWSLSKPQQPYCVGLDCSRFFSLYFWFSASQYRNR